MVLAVSVFAFNVLTKLCEAYTRPVEIVFVLAESTRIVLAPREPVDIKNVLML